MELLKKYLRRTTCFAASAVIVAALSCEKKTQETGPPDRAEMRRRFVQLRDSLGSDSAAVALMRQRFGDRMPDGGPGGTRPPGMQAPGAAGQHTAGAGAETGSGEKTGNRNRTAKGRPDMHASPSGKLPSGQTPGDEALIPVEVSRVRCREMIDYILASTTLEALRTIEIFAKTMGIARELRVEEGDIVSAGDTLVVLDDREARLNLRKAEIAFKEAENALARSREMMSRNLISQEEFETSQLAHENVFTGLREARLAIEYTRVMAPIGGTITARTVELGTMVQQGTALFRLSDFDPLRARIFIPEKELRRLRIGQRVILAVESVPEREFEATITLISAVVDPSSGTFKVTVEIDPTGGLLRPGMFASARIVVDVHTDANVVQAEAVLYDGKQRYLYVIREGAARRIDVETGFIEAGCVEIFGTVETGEQVVVAGHNNLAGGTKVEVVREVDPAGEIPCGEPGSGTADNPAAASGGSR